METELVDSEAMGTFFDALRAAEEAAEGAPSNQQPTNDDDEAAPVDVSPGAKQLAELESRAAELEKLLKSGDQTERLNAEIESVDVEQTITALLTEQAYESKSDEDLRTLLDDLALEEDRIVQEGKDAFSHQQRPDLRQIAQDRLGKRVEDLAAKQTMIEGELERRQLGVLYEDAIQESARAIAAQQLQGADRERLAELHMRLLGTRNSLGEPTGGLMAKELQDQIDSINNRLTKPLEEHPQFEKAMTAARKEAAQRLSAPSNPDAVSPERVVRYLAVPKYKDNEAALKAAITFTPEELEIARRVDPDLADRIVKEGRVEAPST